LDPHPVVARLDMRQAYRVRTLVREATRPLATMTHLMENNAELGSRRCRGIHPPGRSSVEEKFSPSRDGMVEMDIGGIMRMVVERILMTVGGPSSNDQKTN